MTRSGRHSRGALRGLLVAIALAASCTFDGSVPADAVIACAGDTCPDGFLCRPRIGRCVSSAHANDPPPDFVGKPILTPLHANAGTTVQARFRLDAATALPVTVQAGDGSAAAVFEPLDPPAGEPDTLAFAYTVSGAELEGTYRVTADVVGLGGAALTRELGAVAFDFTPPVLLPDATLIAPSSAALGTPVFVRAAFDEPVRTGVQLSANGMLLDPVGNTGGLLTFNVIAAGDGAMTLFLRGVVDEAGNAADDVALGTLAIDGQPPVVRVEADRPRYSAHAPYNVVRATVDATDDRSGVAVFATFAGRAMDCAHLPECTATVEPSDAEGLVSIEVVARDVAGNSGLAQTVAVVDRTGPDIVAGTATARVARAPSSLVAEPEAAAAGASVVVSMLLTEEARAGSLGLSVDGTPATLLSEEQGFAVFRLDVSAAAPPTDGARTAVLTATDAVGNSAVHDVKDTPIPLDRVPPALAPFLGQLELLRAPFGSAESERPTLTVAVDPQGMEPSALLRLSTAASASAVELLRTALADAPFTASLGGQDRVDVYAQLIDTAGNVSAPLRIQNGRFTIGLNVDSGTALRQNESTGRAVSAFTNTLLRDAWTAVEVVSALATVDGARVTVDGGPTAARAGRGFRPLIGYDVGFGGVLTGGTPSMGFFDLGVWDGAVVKSTDALLNPDTLVLLLVSSGSVGSGAVDPVHHQALIQLGSTLYLDLTGTQTRSVLQPAGAHDRSALTYDPTRDGIVVFGGCDFQGDGCAPYCMPTRPRCDDPTLYSYADGQLSPAGAVDVTSWSGPLADVRMAADPVRARVFLMADGTSGTALEVDAAGATHTVALSPGPGARSDAGVVYDPSRQRIVVAGGNVNASARPDVWGYNGTTWSALPSAGLPSDLWRASLGFDAGRDVLVLMGETNAESGTWELAAGAATWLRKAAVDRARAFSTLTDVTIDATTGARTGTALGIDETDLYRLQDQWTPEATLPDPVDLGPAGNAAYDRIFSTPNGVFIVAATGDVQRRSGAGFTPERGAAFDPPLRGAAGAYDPDRGIYVCFGGADPAGTNVTSTRLYDPTTASWTILSNTPGVDGPSERREARMAFDPRSRRVVLAGGIPSQGLYPADFAWAFTGAAWTPVAADEQLTIGVLGADVLGGQLVSAPVDDVTTLLFPTFADSPSTRFDGATFIPIARYDGGLLNGLAGAAEPDRIVVPGAVVGVDALDVSTAMRPALLVDFNLAPARLPAGTAISTFDIDGVAGATGGTELRAFTRSGFVAVAQNDAAQNALASIAATGIDAAGAVYLDALHAAFVTRAGRTAAAFARVNVDAASATVHYTLP